MLRKRVWLNTPWHNYTDKKKHLLTEAEIEQYKLYEEENIAFNHGDFVNGECVTKPTLPVLNVQPNYMLIYNGSVIESRYYVLSYQYMDGEPAQDYGTYRATFIRDVIVDFKAKLSSQPCRIRRGSLPTNEYSPILVQPEGVQLNQVKTNQLDIKSWDGDTQWLTIFYDQTVPEEQRKVTFNLANVTADYTYDEVKSDLASIGFNISETGMDWALVQREPQSYSITLHGNNVNTQGIQIFYTKDRTNSSLVNYNAAQNIKDAAEALKGDIFSKQDGYPPTWDLFQELYAEDSMEDLRDLMNMYNNRLIKVGTAFKKCYFTLRVQVSEYLRNRAPDDEDLKQRFAVIADAAARVNGLYTNNGYTFNNVQVISAYVMIDLVEIQQSCEFTLPGSYKLDNINLSCLTIPFGSQISLKNGTASLVMDPDSLLSIATTGWTQTGTVIKDIQILPYCPMGQLNSTNGANAPSNTIDITSQLDELKVPMKFVNTGAIMYYGLVVTQSSLDYRFPLALEMDENLKVESMTKRYRLMSNNHKSGFEFNLALNNGIQYLSISYTLKPYDTIFRICPVFNSDSLYGGNYKDARGLIWQGGFSLSQVTDAWTEYKLQNSTYESIFDREVKNLEISNDVARQQETLAYDTAYKNAQTSIDAARNKAIVNTVVGVASAAAGAVSGNPMAVMAGVGAMASGLNSAMSIGAQRETAERNLEAAKQSQRLNDTLRAESLDFKKDIWNLTNQAIEARPSTIAANTEYSYINNNKAYIEVYDCTDTEKEFIRLYLQYNGMKIDQIGLLRSYLVGDESYIQATPLFLEGLTPVISNAIQAELAAGIYVQEGLFDA